MSSPPPLPDAEPFAADGGPTLDNDAPEIFDGTLSFIQSVSASSRSVVDDRDHG